VTERRPSSLNDASDPIELSAQATQQALQDAGLSAQEIQSILFIDMLSELRLPRKEGPAYRNPSVSLKRMMNLTGVSDDRCYKSRVCGNMPLSCLHDAAEWIVSREIDCAIITGAESLDTFVHANKLKFKRVSGKTDVANKELHWGHDPGVEPNLVGSDEVYIGLQDVMHGLHDMPSAYAIIEQASRIKHNVSIDERNLGNAKLFHGLSTVAAQDNANSWFPVSHSTEEIATTNEGSNRMVAHPYNKLMCSIMDVNQAASVIVMSDERALQLGIPKDRWVYIHGAAVSYSIFEHQI